MNYESKFEFIKQVLDTKLLSQESKLYATFKELKEIRNYLENDYSNKYAEVLDSIESLEEYTNNSDIKEIIQVYANNIRLLIKEDEEDWDNLLNFDLKTDIQDFVNYVNKKYGIPKIERANKGEKYYIIDSLGRVIDLKEIYDTSDNEYYNLGNYFKSIETAIKFRDTIWKNTWVLRKEIYKD